MMGFVERTDGSFLVATPGHGLHTHVSHQPFLMARAGSRAARALGMTSAHGVVPGAFDMTLADANPNGFVYRCLDHTSLDVICGQTASVSNHSTQMARLDAIVPGARVRSNIEQWATSRISLRGGRIDDSAAHPDAGRVWSFGDYRQRLTDAVNFRGDGTTELRLTSGADARSLTVGDGESEEVWVISAARAREDSTPTRLDHSGVAFEFLSEGSPVMAECPDTSGREVPNTDLPCSHPTNASAAGIAAGRAWPPYSQLCYVIVIVTGGSSA
jgi:hypothetical protein